MRHIVVKGKTTSHALVEKVKCSLSHATERCKSIESWHSLDINLSRVVNLHFPGVISSINSDCSSFIADPWFSSPFSLSVAIDMVTIYF